MDNNCYRIAELAEKAGVTKRTIHYYMGRGLLPPPDGAGLGTTYSDEHLYRVMLIKKLQDAYLPLDEIKKRMAGMKLEDVRENLNSPADTDVGETGTSVKIETDNTANPNEMKGTAYERMDIAFGLEMHFPSDSRKARELADKLYKYAERILKEG